MWIESKKITKGLNGDNSPRYSIILRYGFLENGFQRFPATAAQVGKEFAVIQEIPPQDFGYAEDKMPVRYGFEYFFTQPLPEFHDSLLMA